MDAPSRALHRREQTTDTTEQITRLLHEAGETDHRVFRIVDGADDDWASWYLDLAYQPLRVALAAGHQAHPQWLTYLFVSLDKDYTARQPGEPWATYYAQRIFDHFSSSER